MMIVLVIQLSLPMFTYAEEKLYWFEMVCLKSLWYKVQGGGKI